MNPSSRQDIGIPGANVPGMRRSRLLLGLVLLMGSAASSTPSHAAPANDNWANRVLVSSVPYRNTRSTVGATKELLEGSPGCFTPRATVWYELKLPAATSVVITTTGSTYDTAIAVYVAHSNKITDNVITDCVNDLGTRKLAALGFNAAPGTRYAIQVSGGSSSSQTGTLKIRITTGYEVGGDEVGTFAGNTGISVSPRIVVANDATGTEIIGGQQVAAYAPDCSSADIGNETDAATPPGSACATVTSVGKQCTGP